ncbi:YeeE/YedE family protein [Shewanella sp. Isolate11]|uniref:YeeE/YedE family protein n=1 Tax=Shewanella sp. Isolate11 TaxID=2908530 RepID=UPI001EFC39B9|nr:YeeE/YedE family protein [Shewanella sp. Isolate11]MCG9695703.1 YeeE/YedE family protein [Shewanella sp. Isolate11]
MVSSYLISLGGGVLIGLAAILLMLCNGRIAGVSGILSAALWPNAEQKNVKGVSWQWYFLGGMIISGLLLAAPLQSLLDIMPIDPASFTISTPILVLSGLFVGLGCSLGNGCTSGHGVCGIGRLSLRSIVATCVFMLVAFIVATLLH